MSEKLIDKLRQSAGDPAELSQFERDVLTARKLPLVVAGALRSQLRTLSALSARQGLDNLIAAMPEGERDLYRQALADIQQLAGDHSSEPLPEIHDQPVPPEDEDATP